MSESQAVPDVYERYSGGGIAPPDGLAGQAASDNPGTADLDAIELATSLSLAAHIDSLLIRTVRTSLHPTMAASVEAALWFGPLVARRGGGTVTLDAEALPWLRSRLLARPPGSLASASAVRHHLAELRRHHYDNRYLAVEEDLTWAGLHADSEDNDLRCLGRVFDDLRSGGTIARDIALWTARMLTRLPAASLTENSGVWLLAYATSAWSNGVDRILPDPPADGAERWLEDVLPPDVPTVKIGVRLEGGSLKVRHPPSDGDHELTVPAVKPISIGILCPSPIRMPVGGFRASPRVFLGVYRGVPDAAARRAEEDLLSGGFAVTEVRNIEPNHRVLRDSARPYDAFVLLTSTGVDWSDAQLYRAAFRDLAPVIISRNQRPPTPGELFPSLIPVMTSRMPSRRIFVGLDEDSYDVGRCVWIRTATGSWHVLFEGNSADGDERSGGDVDPARWWKPFTDTWPTTELHFDRPQAARVKDFLLGGKDHLKCDREFARNVLSEYPTAASDARRERLFMMESTRRLASDLDIRQFIQMGVGFPMTPNVHEVAGAGTLGVRVVYVDDDPVVMSYSRALLVGEPGDIISHLEADIRDPARILASHELLHILDLSRPVGLLLVGILHHLEDEEDPFSIVHRLMSALPSGSLLVASHATIDSDDRASSVAEIYRSHGIPWRRRTRIDIARFFDGLEVLDPGIQPLPEISSGPTPAGNDTGSETGVCGGIGRKR